MPTAPVVSSITFDKTSYVKGTLITATVTYAHGDSDTSQAFTGTATDSVTGLSGQLTVNFTVASGTSDATTVTASDAGARTWTKVSDTGTVAVFTATA